MFRNKEIAVIIPAFNEETQIGSVLEVVTPLSWIDQIIVINDGSTDGTASKVREFQVRLTSLPHNQGKGAALQRGISATKADILTFLDADLIGLTENHLKSLIEPLIANEIVAMTVGRFAGGRLATNLSQRIAPILNGQRALRSTFAKQLPDLTPLRFGVEIFISRYAEKHGFAIIEVVLEGLTQVLKEEKNGLLKGAANRYKMYGQLLKALRSVNKD